MMYSAYKTSRIKRIDGKTIYFENGESGDASVVWNFAQKLSVGDEVKYGVSDKKVVYIKKTERAKPKGTNFNYSLLQTCLHSVSRLYIGKEVELQEFMNAVIMVFERMEEYASGNSN